MRFTHSLGLIITVMGCSGFCRAQFCTPGLYSQDYQCVYSDTCSSQVTVHLPDNGWGDTEYSCHSIDCCGQLFTDCYISGYCGAAKKAGMSPAVRKYLEELPLDSELLVADCNGHYAPFKPAARNLNKCATFATKKRSTFALDDGMLR